MKIPADSLTFAEAVEKLLTGVIICPYTDESLFKYLEDPLHQQDVDSYLRRIGRVLRTTQDRIGFFSAYRDPSSLTARQQIRKQFAEAVNDLEPLVRWLRLTASAEKSGAPLQPGDVLRQSEVLGAIESAPALIDELDRLSRTKILANSSTGPKKQLDSILKRLCDSGYLIERGSSGAVFIATGKWSRLYDLLQFINAHESIDPEIDDPEQGGLAF